MWTKFHKSFVEKSKSKESEEAGEDNVPSWLDKYIQYRFHLYDRTGTLLIHTV